MSGLGCLFAYNLVVLILSQLMDERLMLGFLSPLGPRFPLLGRMVFQSGSLMIVRMEVTGGFRIVGSRFHTFHEDRDRQRLETLSFLWIFPSLYSSSTSSHRSELSDSKLSVPSEERMAALWSLPAIDPDINVVDATLVVEQIRLVEVVGKRVRGLRPIQDDRIPGITEMGDRAS